MSVKVWDTSNVQNFLLKSHDKHREFVYDVDFSMYMENVIATASFDKKLCVFNCLAEQPYK